MTESRIAISLFSGAGGDTCGLEAAGWKVSHFSEFAPAAIQTHRAAFPDSELLTGTDGSTDLRTIPNSVFESFKGRVGLLFGGFSCQGFSHAGKKRMDDPRNELVHELVRAANCMKPKWVIGENVKGLLSRKGVYPAGSTPRPVIEIIRDLFEGIGYRMTYRVIDATQVGVPQLRKRLIIVAHRGDMYPHLAWDSLVATTTGIRDYLSSTLVGAVEMPAMPYKPSEQPARFWISTTETVATGTPHPNLVRLVAGIRNMSSKEKAAAGQEGTIQVVEPGGLVSFGVRKGGYYGQVLDPDAPSKTIICAYAQCPRLFVGLHNAITGNYWVRCLTNEECARIQGFPAQYPWRGSAKEVITQIGNAVPPPLATAVARLLETAQFFGVPQGSGALSAGDSESDEE